MLEMNGRDLFNEVETFCGNLKVIYMSAYTSDFITRHLSGNDRVGFIDKPFSMAAFIKIVKEILIKAV